MLQMNSVLGIKISVYILNNVNKYFRISYHREVGSDSTWLLILNILNKRLIADLNVVGKVVYRLRYDTSIPILKTKFLFRKIPL